MDSIEKKKKNEKLLINLLCIVAPLLIIGIWMILAPGKPEHQSIERGSVYFLKEVWSLPSGITIAVFAVLLLIFVLIRRNNIPKVHPNTLSYLIYSLSAPILFIVVVIYAILILQSLLASAAVIPAHWAHARLDDIHLVCITFIVIFGIIVLISWLVKRRSK